MLTMYSQEDTMDSPWFKFFGVKEEENVELDMDEDDTENAQISSKGMHLYKSCPVWEELIFVKCRYCNSSILPHSIKNHVEMRHTGIQKYEKDPESSIFCKVAVAEKKSSLPTVLSSTLTSRASTAAFRIHGSRNNPTSCSADAFSVANLSPRMAEQFLGWPNSPHGAIQQPPFKIGAGVSILAKNQKSALELSASNAMMKHEPYNQSFSFSSTPDIMPSTSTFASSRDMPSTSYEMPSTSYEIPSTSKGLLPCQPLSSRGTGFEGNMMYSPNQQSPSFTYAAGSLESPQQKTPVLEKLVIRRVLQTNPKAPTQGNQSNQGKQNKAKVRKNTPDTYFMVVNNVERKKKLLAKKRMREKRKKAVKKATHRKMVSQRLKMLKHERNKLICQLFEELQSVKKKLDQCNLSKKQIEKELLAVKADLEDTKRTTDFRNEALLKQNAKFENEILKLKLRNEELTTSLEQAQFYTRRHVWNLADEQVSKHFQAIEELEDQKSKLQKQIEQLESESRDLKHSSAVEKGRFDTKLREYFKIITDLKKRYHEQVAKSQELKVQRDFYVKYLSPKVYNEWRVRQMEAMHHGQKVCEIYPGFLTPQPTPPTGSNRASPTVPLIETPPLETQNVNYISFQSQLSPKSPDVFQQEEQQPNQEVIQEEDVS